MSLFVTPEHLAEVTDLVQHKAQIRWLTARGWKFEVSSTGRPKVLVAELERRMLGRQQKQARQLNLSAITASA